MAKENRVALLHALSGATALVVGVSTASIRPALNALLRPLGLALLGLGVVLFASAVAYLGKAFLGTVEPVTNRLITAGPYRLVRHPLYLSMILVAAGLAIWLGSLWGITVTLCIFLPLGIWRARLEEAALARKFGVQWLDYAARTFFMFPPFY